MAKRLAEYVLPPVGAALVVVIAMTLLVLHLDAPTGGSKLGHSPRAQAGARQTPTPPPAPAATPGAPAPTPGGAAAPSPSSGSGLTPVRLVVPAAQVNAPVETVGLTGQGDIGVPSQAADAAWYNGSVAPGLPGNAILDGHLDWWTGPAVFTHLGQLKAGDQVNLVRADGSQVSFSVTGEQVFGANDRVPPAMLATTGPATVSLITCTGSWDTSRSEYLKRLVVNGTLS